MSHKKAKHHPNCLNCHMPLSEFDSFCPNCGQKPTDGKITMHDLVHEVVHTTLHLDGKIFTSLRHLFIPGKLTEEFFRGHHKRYAHPIQMYIVLGALFLFCLAKSTRKAEDGIREQLGKSEKRYQERRLLAKLDSTARALHSYETTPSVRRAIDSLLVLQYEKTERGAVSLYNQIEQDFVENQEEIYKRRYLITLIESKLDSLSVAQKTGAGMRAANLTGEIEILETDSTKLVKSFAKEKKKTDKEALKSLKAYANGKWLANSFRVTINGNEFKNEVVSNDSISVGYKKMQESVKEDVDDEWEEELEKLGNYVSESVKAGWETSRLTKEMERKEKRGELYKKLKTKTLKEVIESDSTGFMSISIANTDLFEMDAVDIVEKYKVEGFWQKRFTQKSIEARQEGDSMFHTYFSKMLWVFSAALLPMAGVLFLLYRRQKRYYVEHLIFMIHLTCLTFLLSPLLLLFENGTIDPALSGFLMLFIGIVPFFAMKRYYKQGWRKTFIKYWIYATAYFFVGMLVFVASAAFSFLFL